MDAHFGMFSFIRNYFKLMSRPRTLDPLLAPVDLASDEP
jgi:hypothetical protein